MSAMMMSKQVDSAIKEMCQDSKLQAAKDLADKFGFDIEEAMKFLKIDDVKLVRETEKKSIVKKTTDKADKKAEKAAKKAAKEAKPKRPLTGYLTYSKAVRPEVKDALTLALGEGEKLKSSAVVTVIGAKWKALTIGEKTHWNNLAKGIVDDVEVDYATAEDDSDEDTE